MYSISHPDSGIYRNSAFSWRLGAGILGDSAWHSNPDRGRERVSPIDEVLGKRAKVEGAVSRGPRSSTYGDSASHF